MQDKLNQHYKMQQSISLNSDIFHKYKKKFNVVTSKVLFSFFRSWNSSYSKTYLSSTVDLTCRVKKKKTTKTNSV